MAFKSARSRLRHSFKLTITTQRALKKAVAAPLVLLAVVTGCTATPSSQYHASPHLQADLPAQSAQICGHPILNSPFSYNGAAGKYSSGTAGLPTYGKPGTDFPKATAGVILPAGKHSYASYELNPDTVYYLLPGKHIGSFQADTNDAFVGGLSNGMPTVISGDYSGYNEAIDSNFSAGDQPGVTIEYLTIEKFQPQGDGAAINQDSNTNWTLQYNTITLNVPGAGAIAGANNTLKYNCMTLNGQYGFQSSDVGSWGIDSLTGGPYNVTVEDNEISYNDTCDFEGLLSNSAIGWSNHNPVPAQYRNPQCGKVTPDGNQGGFKLWHTNGVTIKDNYIHNNWGPGAWADTDNANTTYTGNTITDNDGEAIIEEISYNFSITNNYLAYNDWADGLGNPKFPSPAIYVSQSGSDKMFGGVPACPEASCCAGRVHIRASPSSAEIPLSTTAETYSSGRTRTASARPVLMMLARWSTAGIRGRSRCPHCKSNLPSASINTTTYVSRRTGSPAQDWWNGCLWWTANVSITKNIIDFNPADIAHCNQADWPDCGAGGIFAEYSVALSVQPTGRAGSSLARLRSSRTIPGRTMSTMARRPSTPGTRATATIRLAGPTGLQPCRRVTSAVHPASVRAEPAPARSARTPEVLTAAGRSLRCRRRLSRQPRPDDGQPLPSGVKVRPRMYHRQAAADPLMRDGPRAAPSNSSAEFGGCNEGPHCG